MPAPINQRVTEDEMRKIRNLDDFDLVMLISDIHDCGWAVARKTLALMPEGQQRPISETDNPWPN